MLRMSKVCSASIIDRPHHHLLHAFMLQALLHFSLYLPALGPLAAPDPLLLLLPDTAAKALAREVATAFWTSVATAWLLACAAPPTRSAISQINNLRPDHPLLQVLHDATGVPCRQAASSKWPFLAAKF